MISLLKKKNTDGNIETKLEEVTCPKSQSKFMTELDVDSF